MQNAVIEEAIRNLKNHVDVIHGWPGPFMFECLMVERTNEVSSDGPEDLLALGPVVLDLARVLPRPGVQFKTFKDGLNPLPENVSLNPSLTPALTCSLAQALNSKCLLNRIPGRRRRTSPTPRTRSALRSSV